MADLEFNKNMLSPVGFSFQIKKAPIFNHFIQSVMVPGVTMGYVDTPTPFKVIPKTGDHLTFGDLDVVFKVNEDMTNYIEIFDWIIAMGFPDHFGQHATIQARKNYTGDGIYSDATLIVMSSAMNPVVKINFVDLFPVSLTPFEMNSRDASIEYVESTASFKYTSYTIESI